MYKGDKLMVSVLGLNLGDLGSNPDTLIMLPCFQTRLDWVASW